MQDMPRVAALYRYPVKGLSPELLEQAPLAPGGTMPADRMWAIEAIPGKLDPEQPKHLPKIVFYMLMRDEALARLRTRYDDATATLTVADATGAELARGDLARAEGRAAIEAFVAGFLGAALRGPPRIVSAAGHSFSDVREKCLHVVNLASLRELECIAGRRIDIRRFRANVVLDDLPAWSELDLVGRDVKIGGVLLRGLKRTERCAATNVDPATGARDMAIPGMLQAALGHTDFGIYMSVMSPGTLATGDAVEVGA
jgi:uncharacterized protein YcbX